MKTLLKSLAILTVAALFFTPTLVRAQDDSGGDDDQGVSFQTFYDQLGDQGSWIQTDDYGYVFQPNVSDSDWQPYSDGSWVDSDAGFTWVSDEPWGWATYHYGRWANIDGIGWVWVPGYRWAPAWVSWRYGNGYCGWAPLPPETLYGAEYGDPGVHVGFGFHFGGDVDVNFHIGAGCYNFIRVEDMGERNYRHHFVNRYNNYEIINHTTNITNINVTNNFNNNGGNDRGFRQFHGITAGGPPLNEVNAHAREHIQTVQFTASNQPGKSTLHGNTLAVFAPRVNPDSVHQGKPGVVGQSINHPTFNRGDSISKPLEVTRNVQAPPPSPEAIHAAEQAQAAIPARAKIATSQTPIKTTPGQPLTSLAPVIHTNPHTNPGNPSTLNNPPQTFHPQAQTENQGNPNVIHNNPPQTFHPQTQTENQGNPNVIHSNPPQTFHPQTQTENQGNPNVIHSNPPQTFHPQTQTENQGNPNMIHSNPPQTFHPQAQTENQGNPNVIHNNPPQTFHPQAQTENQGNPNVIHNSPPQTFHPQNQNGGNGGGQAHPSGGGSQGGNHASGGGNGGQSGDGKKDDKKP